MGAASAKRPRAGSASKAAAPDAAVSDAARSKPGLSDAEVDALWMGHEPDALERVHRRYRSRLEAVAYRIVGSHADAEDVVQKIFVALDRAGFRGGSTLWTYLYRAAVNGSVNVLRSRRRRESAEQRLLDHELFTSPRPEFGNPETKVLEGEILAAMAQALLHVKPQHRRVLTLRILHGLSNTEIAAREGLPLATVGTWLRRGREELRRGMAPLLRDIDRSGS